VSLRAVAWRICDPAQGEKKVRVGLDFLMPATAVRAATGFMFGGFIVMNVQGESGPENDVLKRGLELVVVVCVKMADIVEAAGGTCVQVKIKICPPGLAAVLCRSQFDQGACTT
jgi:hypothetical protein